MACPTLCEPMDCSLPGSSVLEILQARILEWIAMPFSRGPSWPREPNHVSWDSRIGRQILYCLSDPYLLGFHALARLGVGHCLPYTLCIMNPPKWYLTSVFVTKARKGFSGSLLYYRNTAMNRMHYRQFSVLLIANGDLVAAIYKWFESGKPTATLHNHHST